MADIVGYIDNKRRRNHHYTHTHSFIHSKVLLLKIMNTMKYLMLTINMKMKKNKIVMMMMIVKKMLEIRRRWLLLQGDYLLLVDKEDKISHRKR